MTDVGGSQYRGRSLAWVRESLMMKTPLAVSAFSMAERYKDELIHDAAQFETNMVVFWGTREPGDCGIYVTDGHVRCLDARGNPRIAPLSVVAPKGVIGAMFWPRESAKKVGVSDGR